jgi:hypothetical protein
MLFVFAFIQYSLLGMQPYVHYLISIGLHCINIHLTHYLLTSFVNAATALTCTIIFAIHPSYATWLGNANMQQYTISTTCVILVALLLKKYLDCHHKKFLIRAILLFGFTLFIRETIIIAPAIIAWLSLMRIINWRKACLLIGAFTVATLPYLTAKLSIFPLTLTNKQPTSFTNFSAKASLWIVQARTFLYDLLGISWFQGHLKIKAFMIIVLLLGILLMFLKNTRKRHIIAALGCMTLLLWPGIMIGYFIPSRFFYEATPAYLIAVALLIEHNSPPLQKIIRLILSVLIIGSIGYTVITVHDRTKEPTRFFHAIMNLKNNSVIQNNPLCFFNLTNDLCWTGLAQQLWLYKINNGQPLFVLTESEPPCSHFPPNTTFITWDYAKNKFYVLLPATSNASAA